MNQKQVKRIKKWTKLLWKNSSEQDKTDFPSYDVFENKVMKDAKSITSFKLFVKEQLAKVN